MWPWGTDVDARLAKWYADIEQDRHERDHYAVYIHTGIGRHVVTESVSVKYLNHMLRPDEVVQDEQKYVEEKALDILNKARNKYRKQHTKPKKWRVS